MTKSYILLIGFVLLTSYSRLTESIEVDECAGVNSCHAKATCNNYFGGYSCSCNLGYEGPGTTCQNTDECRSTSQLHQCVENAICTDTDGSYVCTCAPGYAGEGKTLCSDINECDDGTHNCHTYATCTNTIGSFICQCRNGYRGNGTYCLDIDECAENTDICKQDSSCVNTIGSYNCPCNSGYFGDGKTNCFDIDECTINTDNCDTNALCQNNPGSFTCTCNENFIGNGVTCFDGCNATSIEGNTFNFTIYDKYAFSTSLCDNGRPTASVQCIYNSTSEITEFDLSTLVLAACDLTIQRFIAEVELSSSVTDSSLETITRTMYMLTNTDTALAKVDPANVTTFFDDISDVVTSEKLKISPRTLKNVALTTSILAQSSMTDNLGNSLVQSLEDMTSNVIIEDGQNELSIETDEISIVVTSFNSTTNVGVISHTFANLHTDSGSTPPASISLPSDIVDQVMSESNNSMDNVQSAFFLFESGELFPSNETAQFVVSANINATNATLTLNGQITINMDGIKGEDGKKLPIPGSLKKKVTELQCSSWNKEHGKWSTEGQCRVKGTKTCKYNHLSSFTVLVNHKIVDSDFALTFVSTVGCVLSIFGLGITIGVHASVRKVRTVSQTQVFLHLCSMLALSYVLFLFGVGQVSSEMICTSIAMILHYVLTSTWCWMAVYSHCVYCAITHRHIQSYTKKAAVFAYGAPLIVVCVTAFLFLNVMKENEIEPVICGNENKTGKVLVYKDYRPEARCWLYGDSMLYGFTIPCCVLLFFNIIIFATVMRKVVKPKLMRSSSSATILKRDIAIGVTMAITIGFSWIIGYLMLISTDIVYNKIMSWIFAISSSTQGFLIFLLTALRREELRKVWYDPLHRYVVKPIGESFSQVGTVLKKGGKYDVKNVHKIKLRETTTNNMESYGITNSVATPSTDQVSFTSRNETVSFDKNTLNWQGKEKDQFKYQIYANTSSDSSKK